MDTGTVVWMTIFAAGALCFFVVAAVVSVKGVGDLRELLRSTRRARRRQGGLRPRGGDRAGAAGSGPSKGL